MFKDRLLAPHLVAAAQSFPVLMLTGARQVGKTTLLRRIDPERRFVTLDDMDARALAEQDPRLFLERFPPPVFIDEFQYAPGLLNEIKMMVDEKRTRLAPCAGEFFLSGSQDFAMMEGVSESLAGRVAVFSLFGLSLPEIRGRVQAGDDEGFFESAPPAAQDKTLSELFAMMLRGDKPELWASRGVQTALYYSSYVQTYLERDVRSQLGVRHLGLFDKFMRLAAARIGQLLNMASLAADLGVSIPTVREWLTVLERSKQVLLLSPYSSNLNKRLVRTPKLYFMDTGLAAHLLRWKDAASAMSGPMAGSLFENWAVSEVVKSYRHRGMADDLYFWRTREGKEFDLLRESGGKIHLAEIKLGSSVKNLLSSVPKAPDELRPSLSGYRVICGTRQNLSLQGMDFISAWSLR